MPANGTNSPTAGTAPSSAAGDAVRLAAVAFGFGPAPVVRDVSLSVPAGSFLTILGPSGCGKTTLLKLIGGYLLPTTGRVFLRGRDVTAAPPEARNVGTVFQNYALFPHLTARKNVAFGLEVRRQSKVGERVEALLDRVRLDRDEWDRLPSQLSGGQQQRVAVARALAFGPDVLLLDEPLANLDRHLREYLRAELRRVHAESGTTTLMVTHDQDEALAASDLVGVMHAGRLLQVGPPREVYDRPRTPFVARFLGDANVLDGGILGRPVGSKVLVRPENVTLGGPRAGRVTAVTFYGRDLSADVRADGFTLKIRLGSQEKVSVGDAVTFDIPPAACWPIPDDEP
jgi:ABC-type Fe3+/spermidine/putrescine transport system ATPase subunit